MLIVRRFLQDVSAVIGLVVVAFAVLVALFAEQLAPYPLDAYQSHLTQRFEPPSWEFPFGTDNLGRDLFSRVILGTRSALILAITVVGGAMLIGVPLGLLAGYLGGWLSEVIMRVTDVFLAVPQLILARALAQLMSPSLETAMIALTHTNWPFFARIV